MVSSRSGRLRRGTAAGRLGPERPPSRRGGRTCRHRDRSRRSGADVGGTPAWITETDSITLCRLEYLGSATDWRYALDDQATANYQGAALPTGSPTGTPEEALEHALERYLSSPATWQNPPTHSCGAALSLGG